MILGGYALAWLVTARLLFGRWRAGGTMTSKQGRYCTEHGDYKSVYGVRKERHGCCFNQHATSDGELTSFAMVGALAWPVFLAAVLVRMKAPATPAEVAAREQERTEEMERIKTRNAELERELGIANGATDA
jgi:hypothetical protein